MSKSIRIFWTILCIFLSFVLVFIMVFFILSFPIADKITSQRIDESMTLEEIKQDYTEVFCDEFDGDTLNSDFWSFEGSATNRNNELQTYADSMADGNIEITNGTLNIIAKHETRNGKNYTSASIITQGKVAYKYGIFEMRAKLPQGNGMWPAFWLMGQTNFFDMMMWPITGEIDIMESICGKDNNNTVYSTIHYGGTILSGSTHRKGDSFTLDEGYFYQDYHIFGVVITDREMLFYVDDFIYNRVDISESECDTFRKYDKYILLNLAIGGEWAGAPDASTPFPNVYSIDYVKIYQQQ